MSAGSEQECRNMPGVRLTGARSNIYLSLVRPREVRYKKLDHLMADTGEYLRLGLDWQYCLGWIWGFLPWYSPLHTLDVQRGFRVMDRKKIEVTHKSLRWSERDRGRLHDLTVVRPNSDHL